MASGELFRSLSPLFWFLRLTGGTPFHHSDSFTGMLCFRWCHPQTFWFAFVTIVHLSFVLAQIFGGLFSLSDNSSREIDQTGTQFVINPTVRLTNAISQARFLVDTFMLSKFIHFQLASFQIFFQRLESVDCAVPVLSVVTHRTRNIIFIGIFLNLFWHTMFLIYGFYGIIGDHAHDSGWMFFARIVDNLMHIIGQLHSNMLIILFASLCYIIGLRFAGLTELLHQTVVVDEGTFCDFLSETSLESHNGNLSNTQNSITPLMRNRILPDNESLPDVGPPITISDRLRCQYKTLKLPLSSRLVFFKQLYLTLSEAVLVHFNKVFGLSLLFYLISKLISVSIGCHSFIRQFGRDLSIGLFWYLSIPDIVALFVIFQSADYIRGQVKSFFSSVAKISTQDLTIVERSEVSKQFVALVHKMIQTFILQIRGESIELSVCGLFKLGKQLLPAVAGTIVTYILVLFQFNASEDVIHDADVKTRLC